MTTNSLSAVLSADSHVLEPPELWTSRMDAGLRDQAPRVVRRDDTEYWVLGDGTPLAVVGIQAQAGRRYSLAGTDEPITKRGLYSEIDLLEPAEYLAELGRDGVSGAVLFPSIAHQAYRCVAGSTLTEIARAYNQWAREYCADHAAHLKAVAMINVDDVAAAARQMEYEVSRGAAALLIPVLPAPRRRYDDPEYESIWSAAEELGVSILMHVGGNQAVLGREPPIDLIRHVMKDLHIQASLATIVLSGVFARHPRLRIGAVEFGASWAVGLMHDMDRAVNGRAQRQELRSRPPSEYVRENLFFIFQSDPAAIAWRGMLGVENLLWGNDFPHAESTYPRSREVLTRDLEGVSRDESRRIVFDNTAELFGFDPSHAAGERGVTAATEA